MNSVLNFAKTELNSCSRWFKIILVAAFVIYLSCWVTTIYLNSLQKERNIIPQLPVISKDSEEFAALTHSLVHDKSFKQNGIIETVRSPGYPLFAAIFSGWGRTFFAVTFAQIILVFLSALIVRRIGIVVASRQVGEIAAAMIIINPVSLTLALVLMTDTLFLFLFGLGFYLALTLQKEKYWPRIIAVAVLFSASIYVRQMGLFALPIFAAPVIAAQVPVKIRIKAITFIIAALVITTLPWSLRNLAYTGVASFSSFKSLNLSWATTQFLADQHHTDVTTQMRAFEKMTGIQEEGWRDLRNADVVTREAMKIILDAPFAYARFHVLTAIPFLVSSPLAFGMEYYHSAMHTQQAFRIGVIHAFVRGDWQQFFQDALATWWKSAERLWYLFVYIIAARTIWVYRKKASVWAFVLVIGYLMMLSGPASNARYAFQAFPFIFLLFGTSVVDLYSTYRSKKAHKNTF